MSELSESDSYRSSRSVLTSVRTCFLGLLVTGCRTEDDGTVDGESGV